MFLRPMRYAAAGASSLALAAGLTLVAPQADAAPTYDTAPMVAEWNWLKAQTASGIVAGDYGQTADAIVQMNAISDTPAAKTMADALAPHIDEFATSVGTVGARAKATTAVEIGDPSADTGTSLVTLYGAIGGDGQVSDPSAWTPTYSQLYTVQALALSVKNGATDVKTGLASAANYLLGEQCDNGAFPQGFDTTGTTGHRTCDSGSWDTAADPTTTGLVVGALLSMKDIATQMSGFGVGDVDRALGRAESWLLASEHSDGGWGYAGSASDPDSTGVAGQALAELGSYTGASRAATWIARLQLRSVAGCAPYAAADLGAVAYDENAWKAAQSTPIGDTTRSQFLYQATQALAVLQYLPQAASAPTVTGPTGYVQAGKPASYSVTGLAEGSPACVTVGSAKALVLSSPTGTASATLTTPAGTGNRTVTATASDTSSDTTVVKALAAKTLTIAVTKATVAHGGQQTVKTSGLASTEPVKVIYNGKVIKTAKATSTGTYSVTFPVGSATGTKTVKIQGAFANRIGSKSFTVR